MNNVVKAACSVVLFVSSSAFAQHTISLEECLHLAHTQSPQLYEAKEKYQIARSNAEAQSRSLYTHVDLTLAAPVYSENTTPVFDPATGLTTLYSSHITQFGPGLTITQPITWTGGTLSVTSNLYRESQIPTSGPQTNDYLGLSTIQLNQPLFKTNELALTASEADMALEDAHAQYVAQWVALNYSIERLYYGLYQAEEQLDIQKEVVRTSEANFTLAENKFKAGLIAEVEKLQLEADLAAARTDLFDRERLCSAAQRDLEIALGLQFSDSVFVKLDPLPETSVQVNANAAIERALTHREDILAARQSVAYSENALARTGNQRTISASLSGTFGTSGESQFVDLVNRSVLNRGVTLSVNIPLFDWGAHSLRMDAAQGAIDLSKTALGLKEQQVRQEVLSAIEQIEAAKRQVEVAKQSVIVAQKAYELSRNRFDLGKITSQDLALDEQRLTRARLSALTAEVAVHLAFADLTQKTLFDFERGAPVAPPTW
jgi:outer membrane protein